MRFRPKKGRRVAVIKVYKPYYFKGMRGTITKTYIYKGGIHIDVVWDGEDEDDKNYRWLAWKDTLEVITK
jgi:hypothetical protein